MDRARHRGGRSVDRIYQRKVFMKLINRAIDDFLFALLIGACLVVAALYKLTRMI
jgi:hypothetical protein